MFLFIVFISYYSPPKRHSIKDEHILNNQFFIDRKIQLKRRSVGSSSSIPTYKMQQNMTNESNIGVPSPLCSVCGDISTGK